MRNAVVLSSVLVAGGILFAAPVGAQVIKETVPGITNFSRVEATLACAGAIKLESVPQIKRLGYQAIINLRLASEPDAMVEEEGAAAKAAGINYVHIPFSTANPDPAAVDTFLKTITTPGLQPAFIHCAGGSRAAGMWLIKRVLVDGWETNRALEEATALGLTGEPMKKFALEQIEQRRKKPA